MELDITGDIVDSIPVGDSDPSPRRLTCCLKDDFASRIERDIAGDSVDSIPVGGPNSSLENTNLLPQG
jgi:hypothetical protein